MKPLDYQSSPTPPRCSQRFNRLEQSLGTAALLSFACAAASLLPLLAALSLYSLYRLAPGLAYLTLLLGRPLLPLLVLCLPLPFLGTFIAPFGLRGPKKNIARLALFLNLALIAALLALTLFFHHK